MRKYTTALIAFLFCLFPAQFCFGDSLMTQQELDELGEQIYITDRKKELNACSSIGDSAANGIDFTRKGCSLLRKESSTDDDVLSAVELFTQAAKLNEPYAFYFLGALLSESDPEKSQKFLLEAANSGIIDAHLKLAGLLIDKNDWNGGEEWLLKAYEKGSLEAEARLGTLYVMKSNLDVNSKEYTDGRRHLMNAAMKGQYHAQQASIGLSDYLKISQEDFDWFLKEANSGNTDAYIIVGMMYEKGVGIKRDKIKAHEWYAKAIRAGLWMGVIKLDVLLNPVKDKPS